MFISLFLLFSVNCFPNEPPGAQLVLKESYLISKGGVSSIVPLNQQYLCLSTFAGEIKIFDRLKKEVVLTENSLQNMKLRPFLRHLVQHNNHLYAEVQGDLYTYPFEWKDKSKLPSIGPAQLVDLKGDEVKGLWGAGGTALCCTETNKIYWLEDGRVLWNKFINVEQLTGETLKRPMGVNVVWLVTVGTQTKLFVCLEKQLQVFDFPTLKKEKEFSVPGPFVDITYSKDRFFIKYITKLGVMDLQGKIKYSKTYDYREMKYFESKNLLLLWGVQQSISIASVEGEIGKEFKIPSGVFENPFVDGNLVYFGFDAYNGSDEYVGGGYLRVYEIVQHD